MVDDSRRLDTCPYCECHVINHNLLSFRLNAAHDVLPTPVNLHLWKKIGSPICTLCYTGKGTLHHILNNCKVSLDQGRYTWRHDQVLSVLVNQITCKLKSPIKADAKPFINFVPAGTEKVTIHKKKAYTGLLDRAEDWTLLVDDIENMIVFPSFIAETSLRPDIVIWSRAICKVIIIELCPSRDKFGECQSQKTYKMF